MTDDPKTKVLDNHSKKEESEFFINKRGVKVHRDLVPIDQKIKNDLVNDLVNDAIKMSHDLKSFKSNCISEVESFINILREKYHLDILENSLKGNITLENYSGTAKVVISVSDKISFDEKITLAKEKIDVYLKEVTSNSTSDIKTLITNAFDVDKKGNVSPSKILTLKSYDIKHPLWKEAMKILDDAIEIVGTRSYIRFYRKDESGKYKLVPLDLAKL